MPYAKKPGARCKAGYKQWGKGSLTCMKNANYVKGARKGGYVHKQPRRKVNGLPDMRFKANR